jgi:hypothetical protein
MRWLSVDFGIRSVRPAAPAAVNYLHKVKEIVEIQHSNRPCGWTLSCDFRDF